MPARAHRAVDVRADRPALEALHDLAHQHGDVRRAVRVRLRRVRAAAAKARARRRRQGAPRHRAPARRGGRARGHARARPSPREVATRAHRGHRRGEGGGARGRGDGVSENAASPPRATRGKYFARLDEFRATRAGPSPRPPSPLATSPRARPPPWTPPADGPRDAQSAPIVPPEASRMRHAALAALAAFVVGARGAGEARATVKRVLAEDPRTETIGTAAEDTGVRRRASRRRTVRPASARDPRRRRRGRSSGRAPLGAAFPSSRRRRPPSDPRNPRRNPRNNPRPPSKIASTPRHCPHARALRDADAALAAPRRVVVITFADAKMAALTRNWALHLGAVGRPRRQRSDARAGACER